MTHSAAELVEAVRECLPIPGIELDVGQFDKHIRMGENPARNYAEIAYFEANVTGYIIAECVRRGWDVCIHPNVRPERATTVLDGWATDGTSVLSLCRAFKAAKEAAK